MADITTSGKTRKPLNPKTSSQNEANIAAGKISHQRPTPENPAGKENSESLSHPKSRKIKQPGKGKKQTFEKEVRELEEKLQNLKLEKQQMEETLKLRLEELESRGREQEKAQMELKKLRKMKEFKPTTTLPILHSLEDKDQANKKKGCSETKRPPTAYIMWSKEHWNEVKKENPEAEFTEISHILGTKWKLLNPEEKKPYEEKYQVEKAAYSRIVGNEKRENEAMKLLEEERKQKTARELLEQYIQFKQEAEKEGDPKKTKKEKDPLKPKRPESAYFLFMNERRAALTAENKKFVEVAKITGEEWKNMRGRKSSLRRGGKEEN